MTTNTNAAQVANNLIAVAEDQAFEAWYKQDCLVGGVNARIAARAAWNARAALTTAAAVPAPVVGEKFQRAWIQLDQLPGTMMVGPEGRFGPIPASTSAWITTSEEERDRCLSAGKPMLEMWLAAAPKAEPAVKESLTTAHELPPGIARDDTVHGEMYYTAEQVRAMLAQAAPKQEAGTYHLGACITDGMLHATVMRKAPGSAGAVTVLLSEAIPVGSLQDHDVVVDAATQAAPTSSASVEITDEQMHQGLAAAFAHPRAAAPDAVFKAGVDFGVSVALLQTAPTTQATPQPAVQQEPVAIVTRFHDLGGEIDWTSRAKAPVGAKLYLAAPVAQGDAEDAARWRAHVGKLDALVAYCPTCCQGVTAGADMPRDEVIFQCGRAQRSAEVKRLREALDTAIGHIDMDALRVSHCNDAALIDAARSQAKEGA